MSTDVAVSAPDLVPDAAPERIDYSTTLSQRAKMLALAGVLLGLLLAALDQTIVATALPRIVRDLQGIDLLSWVSTAYLLASTTMVPVYGKLSDIYGRKAILLFGIVLFLVASALCGLAPSMLTLVLFRALQGLGAAALTSTAFAVPADLFPPHERARYQGIFGAVFGLASVIGPYLGGLLTDGPGWRWVFYINLPLGLVAMAFIVARMPKLQSGVRSKIDYLGAALLVTTVVPLLLALTLDKAVHPWTSGMTLGLLALSAFAAIAFYFAERNNPHAILPFRLFRLPIFSLLSGISFLVGATFFAVVIFLSIFLVNVLGVSATAAGTALIPLTMSMVPSSIVSSMLVHRTGRYKALMLFGLTVIVIGLYLLSGMSSETTLWGVRGRMVLLGIGLGPTLPILTLALQNAVPFEMVGAATASRQFFQQLGQATGAAVFGVLLTTTLTSSLHDTIAPLQARMPPAVAAQFSAANMRNGAGGGEGGARSERVSVEQRIAQSIAQGFARRRVLIERALVAHDGAAARELLADPHTPEQLRGALAGEGLPEGVAQRVSAQAQAASAAAEPAAIAEGRAMGRAVDRGLREAFTRGITRTYFWSVPAALLALLLMFFVPEIPLRRTNRDEPLPTAME